MGQLELWLGTREDPWIESP